MDMHPPRVRVALIGCSGLLGDIIERAIAADPGLDIVAEVATPPEDLDEVRFEADVVLWNEADEDRVRRWLDVAGQRAGPRIVATVADGQSVSLWELAPRRTELGAVSPAALVSTIRRSPTTPGPTGTPPTQPTLSESRRTP